MKNQKGFSVVEGLLILVIVCLIGGVGWYVWNSQKKTNDSLNSAASTDQSTAFKKNALKESTSTDKLLDTSDWKLYRSAGSPGVVGYIDDHVASTTTNWEDYNPNDNLIVNFTIKTPQNWIIDLSEIYVLKKGEKLDRDKSDNPGEILGVVISKTSCYSGLPNADYTPHESARVKFISQQEKKLGKYQVVIRTEERHLDSPELYLTRDYCVSLGNNKYFVVGFYNFTKDYLAKNEKLIETFVSTVKLD